MVCSGVRLDEEPTITRPSDHVVDKWSSNFQPLTECTTPNKVVGVNTSDFRLGCVSEDGL